MIEKTIEEIEALAEYNQTLAREVIAKSGVIAAWENIGATVNLVGSLSTGLLMTHHDIDFHIYTATLDLSQSFTAISQICRRSSATRLEYSNFAETQESCLEWHLWIKDRHGDEWQLDIIQLPQDSPFAGYFEHIAERIKAVLTPETRRTILALKYITPSTEKIMGIEYYQAVLAGGVRTWDEFTVWRATHPATGIVQWCP